MSVEVTDTTHGIPQRQLRSFSATLRHCNKAGHSMQTIFSGRMKTDPKRRLIAVAYEIGRIAQLYDIGSDIEDAIQVARANVITDLAAIKTNKYQKNYKDAGK